MTNLPPRDVLLKPSVPGACRGTSPRPPLRGKNLLHVTALDPSVKFGSLEEQILAQAQACHLRGATFGCVFPRAPEGRFFEALSNSHAATTSLDLWQFSLGRLRRLINLVVAQRVGVVDWQFYDPLSPYVLALRLLFPRLRLVYTHHSSRELPYVEHRPLPKRLLKRALLRSYHTVLPVSDFVADCLLAEGWWPALARYHHFVNLGRFRPDRDVRASVRARLGTGDRFIAVSVAQLIHQKGLDVLIDAWQHVPEPSELWLIGEGPAEDALRRIAQDTGQAQRVRFLGPQPFVEQFLQAADVAVCPSVWGEAAGLINLEAAACGLPVVASRVGGIPEFVLHEETGVLTDPGDAQALGHALRALYHDPRKRGRMGDNARALAQARYSADQCLSQNLDLLGV